MGTHEPLQLVLLSEGSAFSVSLSSYYIVADAP